MMAVLVPVAGLADEQPNECLKRPTVPSTLKPKLTKSDVFSVAAKAAEAHGYNLLEYEVPSTCFSSKELEWFVFYRGRPKDGKIPMGHHFGVVIQDSGRVVRVVPGV